MKKVVILSILINVCIYSQAQTTTVPALERKVTINAENQPIEAVLADISSQAGFVFSYSPEAINAQNKTTIHASNKPVKLVLNSMFDALLPPGLQWYWAPDFVTELSDAAIKEHIKHGSEMPTPLSTMHMYPIDGAASRVGKSDTPWAYRDAKWAMIIGGIDPDPANADKIRGFVIEVPAGVSVDTLAVYADTSIRFIANDTEAVQVLEKVRRLRLARPAWPQAPSHLGQDRGSAGVRQGHVLHQGGRRSGQAQRPNVRPLRRPAAWHVHSSLQP